MKFSIFFFIIFGIKVRICDAVIYTLEIGDPITCRCRIYGNKEISWTLQKVNGEEIPLVTYCQYPYKNCPVQNYEGGIFLEVYNDSNKLTVHHVKQDMFRLKCIHDYFLEYIDNCTLNVVDSFGASPIGSPIHTLNQGDPFTCDCDFYRRPNLKWTLQKVNGEMISLVTHCYTPFTSCVIRYNPTNFEIQTGRVWDSELYRSKLTVKHVDRDMFRVFCLSDFFGSELDRCLMNVLDYVRSDNDTRKSTDSRKVYSTTHAPDVYLTTYFKQSFPTTRFQFLFPTTPEPAAENYTSSVALRICVTVLPLIALFIVVTLAVCCCCRKKKLKDLHRHNEAIRVISNASQLTPATFSGPDQNDLSSTHVNPLVHPSNNTLTTESQHHTASIQSTAPKDSPPPYSSLLELRVEPPPYTALTAESYNHVSAPSQQAENVPPPYSTRYNCVSPSAQQQAPNEPPPPYSVWHTS